MITLTQRTMHGGRVFISFFFDLTGRSRPAAALNPEPLNLFLF
jgi:hypothetical protein